MHAPRGDVGGREVVVRVAQVGVPETLGEGGCGPPGVAVAGRDRREQPEVSAAEAAERVEQTGDDVR